MEQMNPMPDVLATIDQVSLEADSELALVHDASQLEQFRIKYLSAKGKVAQLMTLLGQVPKDQKPVVGQRANAAKSRVQAAYNARKTELEQSASAGESAIDVTEPGKPPRLGNRHILTRVIDELADLFGRMGFSRAAGPEVEDEFHNFVALNIAASHPARDPLDNFYLARSNADSPMRLLRTQTSTVQIRVMETTKPPIRVVIPGRVFRPDTHDQTHLSMFHQLEALVVDRGVTMIDLKSTVMQFVHAYFGPDTRVRFRPSFFPFTEPSAEVDVWFDRAGGKGKWIELGGCGMVHPNVFRSVNIDPDEFSGWAFGFGVERIAMRKYGVEDIRAFVENDIRFLQQF
jgi:phenylalanyl-tRNA synthetase alpha chain